MPELQNFVGFEKICGYYEMVSTLQRISRAFHLAIQLQHHQEEYFTCFLAFPGTQTRADLCSEQKSGCLTNAEKGGRQSENSRNLGRSLLPMPIGRYRLGCEVH
jgi:hypothetical protein